MDVLILNRVTVAKNCRAVLVLEKDQATDLDDDLANSLIKSGDAKLIEKFVEKTIQEAPENKMFDKKLNKKTNK